MKGFIDATKMQGQAKAVKAKVNQKKDHTNRLNLEHIQSRRRRGERRGKWEILEVPRRKDRQRFHNRLQTN